MEALISGQAGLAIVLGHTPQIRPVGGEPRKVGSLAIAHRLLDGCQDVVARTLRNIKEVDAVARRAWNADRGLRLCLLMLEDDNQALLNDTCFDLLEKILSEKTAFESIEARLFADEIPDQYLSKVISACGSTHRTSQCLLQGVQQAQEGIRRARAAFDALPPDIFGASIESRSRFLSKIVIEGGMSDLAKAISKGTGVDFAFLSLMQKTRGLDAASEVLKAWGREFRQSDGRTKRAVQPELDWREDRSATQADGGRRAFENAMQQQAAIVERLKERDVRRAVEFTDSLVRQQMQISSPQHIAKSLSRLSHMAKVYEIPDLQLKWALEAVSIFPDDPITYGHLADAYIGLGKLFEADQALLECETRGDPLFARTIRAKILMLRGDYPASRALYLSTAAEFDTHDGVEHAYAGAAECLKDMGRLDESLKEYEKLSDRWPFDSSLHSARAAVLLELGRFSEANAGFVRAGSTDKTSSQAENGRAHVARIAGNLADAERIYRDVLTKFPNNSHTLSGLAEVLRLVGRNDEAIELLNEARQRAPFSPLPIIGMAECLRDRGEFAAMHDWIARFEGEFAEEPQLFLLKARALQGLSRLNESLMIYDQIIAKHPFFTHAECQRADFLRRTGRHPQALAGYEALLAKRPRYMAAVAGRAASLIALGRLKEASWLLPEISPRSQGEWSRYLLRALYMCEEGAQKGAIRLLERGIQKCPFARNRRLMKNALTTILLRRSDYKAAGRTAEPMPGEMSNVIYLHALLATHRTGQARKEIEAIKLSGAPREVIYIAEQVGKLFGAVEGPADLNRKQLLQLQTNIVLEAA